MDERARDEHNARMNDPRWTEVDRYIESRIVGADETLDAALTTSAAAGLPAIHVAPNQGKLLHLLARLCGARTILEIGTLGGYSTIWLARALPAGGRLITLESQPTHAQVATENLRRAGLDAAVEVRIGPALETLPELEATGRGPFDFVFIDADKPSNADYFAWAVRLARVGTLIVVDNVVRQGAVAEAASTDANVQGSRRLFDAVAAEPRVAATSVQTVGVKGYDGLLLAVVTS